MSIRSREFGAATNELLRERAMKKKSRRQTRIEYMFAIQLLKLSIHHLIGIENYIGDFYHSKPVNVAIKDLEEIRDKLLKNIEHWTHRKWCDLKKPIINWHL